MRLFLEQVHRGTRALRQADAMDPYGDGLRSVARPRLNPLVPAGKLLPRGDLFNVDVSVSIEFQSFIDEWDAKLTESRTAFRNAVCPPTELRIPNANGDVETIRIDPHSGGEGPLREYPLALTDGESLTAKMAPEYPSHAMENLMHEAAALTAMADYAFVPTLQMLVGHVCSLTMIVVGNEDSSKIVGLPEAVPGMTLGQFAGIAVRMIQIVRIIHERGIVHGDLNSGFRYTDGANVRESLKLVKFGSARSYIDAITKGHITKRDDSDTLDRTTLPTLRDTVYQLREPGQRKSRADDAFGLAELLIDTLVPPPYWWRFEEPEHWYQAKMRRNPSHLPNQLRLLYEYCSNLGFTQIPDYLQMRRWMQDLESSDVLISSFSHDPTTQTPRQPSNVESSSDDD